MSAKISVCLLALVLISQIGGVIIRKNTGEATRDDDPQVQAQELLRRLRTVVADAIATATVDLRLIYADIQALQETVIARTTARITDATAAIRSQILRILQLGENLNVDASVCLDGLRADIAALPTAAQEQAEECIRARVDRASAVVLDIVAQVRRTIEEVDRLVRAVDSCQTAASLACYTRINEEITREIRAIPALIQQLVERARAVREDLEAALEVCTATSLRELQANGNRLSGDLRNCIANLVDL